MRRRRRRPPRGVFTSNVLRAVEGAKILVAHAARARSIVPDFLLPTGFRAHRRPRVLRGERRQGFLRRLCRVRRFTGDSTFGAPTPLTRTTARCTVALTGRNRRTGRPCSIRSSRRTRRDRQLAGDALRRRHHLAGRGVRRRRAGAPGRRSGSRRASSRAPVPLRHERLHACGNDAINAKECDGGDLGERTCQSLGYTGGSSCSDKCKITTSTCEPSSTSPAAVAEDRLPGRVARQNGVGGPNEGQTAAQADVQDGDAAAVLRRRHGNGTCRSRSRRASAARSPHQVSVSRRCRRDAARQHRRRAPASPAGERLSWPRSPRSRRRQSRRRGTAFAFDSDAGGEGNGRAPRTSRWRSLGRQQGRPEGTHRRAHRQAEGHRRAAPRLALRADPRSPPAKTGLPSRSRCRRKRR